MKYFTQAFHLMGILSDPKVLESPVTRILTHFREGYVLEMLSVSGAVFLEHWEQTTP